MLSVLHVAARWYHFGLVLQGPPTGGTTRPPRGVRWRLAAVTCSSAGSEGSGHGREEWSWSTVLGAVQRCLRPESAWSTAAHCRQLSECLVPNVVPQQEEVWGIDWSYCCPYIRCLSLLLMTRPLYLDDSPSTLMYRPLPDDSVLLPPQSPSSAPHSSCWSCLTCPLPS